MVAVTNSYKHSSLLHCGIN